MRNALTRGQLEDWIAKGLANIEGLPDRNEPILIYGCGVLGRDLEAGDGVVVEVGRDRLVLHAGGLGHHVFLTGDVAGVFDVVFDEGPDLGGEAVAELGGQGDGGVFGSLEPFLQADAVEPGLLQELPGGGDGVELGLGVLLAEVGDEADLGGEGGEAEVAVVLTEEEAVFGAGGEEAVGFGGAFGRLDMLTISFGWTLTIVIVSGLVSSGYVVALTSYARRQRELLQQQATDQTMLPTNHANERE